MEMEDVLRSEVEKLRSALEAPPRPSWIARLASTLLSLLV